MTTAKDRIAAGYAEQDSRPLMSDERVQERRAAAFRPNPKLEHFLVLQASDPARAAQATASQRMELGYYVLERDAAIAAGSFDPPKPPKGPKAPKAPPVDDVDLDEDDDEDAA